MAIPSLFLDLSVVIELLHLGDRLLHDLLNQLVVCTLVDLFNTLCQVLALRLDVLAGETSCQQADHRVRDARGTSDGAAAAAYAVEGLFCALFKLAALCVCNVLHNVQVLRAGLCAGVAADAAVNFRIKLHHDLLVRLDLVDVISTLVCGEERNACNIHALLHLCLAGQAGLQLVLTL